MHIARRQKSRSSAVQQAEHERNAARSLRSLHMARRHKSMSFAVQQREPGAAIAFAAGDIRGEQQGRQSWQPAPCLPSEPFCHALNEVSPRPGEPDHDKDLL